jgi:hypothetical protein
MSQQTMHSYVNVLNCRECYEPMSFNADKLCIFCEICEGIDVLLTPQCNIRKIGIELEGGWYEMPSNEHEMSDPLHSYTWHTDTSVDSLDMGSCGDCDYCNDGDDDECSRGNGHAGEIISFPTYIDDVDEYGNLVWHMWTKRFYPEIHNSDCGGHFHVSFDNIQAFEFLCTIEFFDHFQRELHRWGVRANIKNKDFWDRLNGENSMCKTTFRGVEQLYTVNDNYPDCRYSILNFQYNKHGTLEFRILPMFDDLNIYIKAIQVCMDITQKYLDKMANKPISIESGVTDIDFEGKINYTMVQDYMNTEPAELELVEEEEPELVDISHMQTPTETDIRIVSTGIEHDSEQGDSMGYVTRYTYRYGSDGGVYSGHIIQDSIREDTMSNARRVDRFTTHFAMYGLELARRMFYYDLDSPPEEIQNMLQSTGEIP